MQKGFTLIETLIYLALFTIIIGGGMVATYQIIQSSAAGTNHVIMEEEANFLLRKMNWALVGASSIPAVSATHLEITNTTGTYSFNLCGTNLTIETGAGKTCGNTPITLNASSISITSLTFQKTPAGNGITVNFTLKTMQDGKPVTENFSTTKYLRK